MSEENPKLTHPMGNPLIAFLLGLGLSAFLITTWHSYAIGKIERRLEAVEAQLRSK